MINRLRRLLQLLFRPLQGWKLVILYTVTTSLSIGVAYAVFEEDVLEQYAKQEYKLQEMNLTLKQKNNAASDFKSLQVLLDNAQGKQTSCVIELENRLRTPEYKALSQSQKNAHKRQWDDCVGKEQVLSRIEQFFSDKQSNLAVFENPMAVLDTLSQVTHELGLDNVRYSASPPNTEDFFAIMPLQLHINMPNNQLIEYLKQLDAACSNCVVKLISLIYDRKTQFADAKLQLSLYLDPLEPKQDYKKWLQAISEGKLSGDNLAAYGATLSGN